MNTIRKPAYCKSCFAEIRLAPCREMIENNPLLCDKCISKINTKLEVRKIFDIEILFLSDYDGLMKTWLMNYKEFGDIELAPCFLYLFKPFLRVFFPGYTYVPCPSSDKRIQKRGFDHLSEMLKSSSLPYEQILCQKSVIEQKNEKGTERFKDKGIVLKEGIYDLSEKKIVLFDDVFTTGSTFYQSLMQIRKHRPKRIKGVIIMDNQKTEERKIKI